MFSWNFPLASEFHKSVKQIELQRIQERLDAEEEKQRKKEKKMQENTKLFVEMYQKILDFVAKQGTTAGQYLLIANFPIGLKNGPNKFYTWFQLNDCEQFPVHLDMPLGNGWLTWQVKRKYKV